MREVKEIVSQFIEKRTNEITNSKELYNKINSVKDSVKVHKEINIPQNILVDKIEAAAKELINFFGAIPEKVILTCMNMAPYFLDLVKLEKVITISTELEANQKLPFVYLAEYEGQKFILVDTLQLNEDKYPEAYPTLLMRVLVLSGIKQFFIISETLGADPSLKAGDAFLFENYIPMNAISPFIGKTVEEWGERFLDVMEIFSMKKNETVKAALNKSIPLTIQNILWMNSSKTYGDEADIRMAQRSGVLIIASTGMIQALVVYDMKAKKGCADPVGIGIIQRNLHTGEELTNERRKELAEKLIHVLSVKLT